MAYVDGFLLVVPTKNIKAYKKLATLGAKVWKDHGALEYRECVGDDMKVPFGLQFPKLTKAKAGETVVFSWIVYKSKADRNRVNAKVMKDPRMAAACDPGNMPFDVKKMSWGGFKVLVGA
ncbi:MAG: DUF1428 domain-containing protein [Phycisphaeraceae bacterium]|nr:DUF1428 domain-containing protein [Phycisphaeraceae bacterium]